MGNLTYQHCTVVNYDLNIAIKTIFRSTYQTHELKTFIILDTDLWCQKLPQPLSIKYGLLVIEIMIISSSLQFIQFKLFSITRVDRNGVIGRGFSLTVGSKKTFQLEISFMAEPYSELKLPSWCVMPDFVKKTSEAQVVKCTRMTAWQINDNMARCQLYKKMTT